MNAILTGKGRQAMDLIHLVTRGNRRFSLIKEPERDMRGFIVELKRVTPSTVGEYLLEVTGLDRFIAETVYIPEERRDLYLNES